jgi:hypothetical protein
MVSDVADVHLRQGLIADWQVRAANDDDQHDCADEERQQRQAECRPVQHP